ncbi:MAG: CRISPR-associated endonuclease Cas1 [Bacteroidota bacterium]|nr:CRISPR-associated endonuclease Cas1 [Bacteroidota bacterium]
MIKRTLYFGNPAHLYMRKAQLCISYGRKNETDEEDKVISIPIEDIGVVVLDHEQITISHSLIANLLDNNAALITCNNTHHPTGLMLPLSVNTTQTEKFKAQIEASEPLKKQLWAQTVIAKLKNQSRVLQQQGKDDAAEWLVSFTKEVKSGDTDNHEARGAAIYWQNIFDKELNFRRSRDGRPPNNLLNYGYSILRAIVARGLVGSGMLPTFGIFHRNKYNAYCLADDIMEPYRPYVDQIVLQIIARGLPYTELSKELKAKLLELPAVNIMIENESSPLMVGLQRTTASLMKCFEGDAKKIIYPEL